MRPVLEYVAQFWTHSLLENMAYKTENTNMPCIVNYNLNNLNIFYCPKLLNKIWLHSLPTFVTVFPFEHYCNQTVFK